ncbi:MAG: hypothetical protein GC179_08685 [Anaerolineaceae bacterium]|nr:hypothetical protein [Anaerolineaceae bacterium]
MPNDPLNQIELISTLSVPRYAPRLKPTPIPGANWNDAPLFCLKLNDEWVSHVLGVLTALDQPDTWLGTPEQIYAARQQVNEIMVAFMTACSDCEVQFRIEDCHLQWRETDADEWIDLGNVCGADGSDGVDGAPGQDGEDGNDGPPGPPGPAGADGSDCDCTDYNHIPTPDNPPGSSDDDTACNIAAGIADWIRDKERLAQQQANSAASIALAIGGLAAAIAAAVVTGGTAWPLIVSAATVLINIVLAADGAERDAMFADDSFWAEMACSIYCVIKPNKDIDAARQAAIGAAIRATTYTSGSYDAPFWYDVAADFLEALPNEIVRANVAIGALVSYDCSDCDCPSECDVYNWDIFDGSEAYGTIVERGADYITADLSFAPATVGFYFLRMKSSGINVCCSITNIEVISGGTINIASTASCGVTQDGVCPHAIGGAYPSESTNCFVIGATGATRVKISFA